MNPRHARANLMDADRAIRATGARPFLADGTLLGAVREHALIPHDRDLDLGVFVEEADAQRIIRALTGAGFLHRKTFGTMERGLELSFRRHWIKLDVFFYYRDAVGRYHAAWPSDGVPIRYRYDDFSLALLPFLFSVFLAPADPERFLVTKYGPEWRTPVTVWDWRWDPRNATPWDAVPAESAP